MQENNRNKVLKYSSIVGATFAVIWWGFWEYCYQTAPRQPNELSINAVNYHGTAIYLTNLQYFILYGIPITALGVGIISALLIRYRKQ